MDTKSKILLTKSSRGMNVVRTAQPDALPDHGDAEPLLHGTPEWTPETKTNAENNQGSEKIGYLLSNST